MRKLFPLTLLTWQRSRHPGPSLAISARKSIGPINQLSLPLRTVWHSACGIPADLRNSGNLVWLHCLRYTTPQQQQVWACYSPPHSSFPAGHSPANPYNSGPSQEISCERGSVPLRSQDSACLWRHNNSRTQTISPIPILLRMTTTLSRCYVDQQIGPTLSSCNRRRSSELRQSWTTVVELGWNNSRTRVGVAELSAGRVAWARNAEAMSRLGNDSDF